MKKKIALCLIMGCLASTLWGCNTKDIVETISKETEAEDKKDDEKEEENQDEAANEEAADEESSKTSGNPVLGDEDIEDYEDFKYLYCEEIRTESEKNEETGKMESKKLSVFVPESDYVSVSTNRVRSEKLGVSIEVQLEPYIRYDSDDYLMSENLQYYLEESEYDPYYSNNYKDLVISEVEEIDEEIVYATVEYCDYNKYADSYSVVFVTYYLAKLDNDATVLVEVAVNSEDVTGKTPALIEELEAFYPFEIDWDKERAEAKLEDYLASGGESTVSTGYAIFELPEGWSEDISESDYDTYVYAPDGDANFAECFVSIYREYLGYDTFEDGEVDDYQDEIIGMVEESMQEEGVDAVVTWYGDTCLGSAVKAEARITEDGETANTEIYWIFDDSYGYVVTAVMSDNAIEDAFVVAEDMLKNGQTR